MTESRRLGLRIALPAIGVAVALLLAGCSSSGGASSTSAASKTNFGGVKLTVWNSIDYNPYEAQQKSFFEKCGKKLGITVDDQTINGDYASALLKAAGSKSLPGIVQLSTDVELPTLAAEGALANLHSLGVSTEGESSSVSSLGTYKGTLYGLPSNIENYAIFYDKVAFAYDPVNNVFDFNTQRYTVGYIYYFTSALLFEGDYEFTHSNDPSQTDTQLILQISYGF